MTDNTTPIKGTGTQFLMAKTAGKVKPDPSSSVDVLRLAKVTDITPPEMSAEASEENYLDAEDPQWKEKSAGQIDPGELGITLAWKPGDANQTTMVNQLGGEPRWFFIKFPNGAYDAHYGFVSKVGKAIPAKEKITRTFGITLTGKQALAEHTYQGG